MNKREAKRRAWRAAAIRMEQHCEIAEPLEGESDRDYEMYFTACKEVAASLWRRAGYDYTAPRHLAGEQREGGGE